MADSLADIINDPDFAKLSREQQYQLVGRVEPEFLKLGEGDKTRFISGMAKPVVDMTARQAASKAAFEANLPKSDLSRFYDAAKETMFPSKEVSPSVGASQILGLIAPGGQWQGATSGLRGLIPNLSDLGGMVNASPPIESLRSIGNLLTSPSSLLARATANREAAQTAPSVLDSVQITKPLSVIKAGNNATLTPRAFLQEKMARFLANGKPIGPEVAADELARSYQWGNEPIQQLPGREIAANRVNITNPGVSPVNQRMLDALRSETPSSQAQAGMEQAWTNRGNWVNEPRLGMPTNEPGATAYNPAPDTGLPSMKPPNTSADLNHWMNVTTNQMVHGANPGKQLLEEGLLGADKQATLANTQAALADAGQQLEAHLQAAAAKGITLDAQTPVYDALNAATKRIGAPKDAAFTSQINGILDDIEGKYPNLAKLPADQVQALKVELGKSIKWTGTTVDDPINKALMQIYSDLNQAIKDNVPGSAQLQARWGNLYQATRALKTSLIKDAIGRGTGAVPVQ